MSNEKFILDATSGFRSMWFNKHHPNTIYLDQRPECEPDIVADHTDLKQFKDETFRLIVFDPPHIIRPNGRNMMQMVATFGALEPDTWRQDLKKAFSELWRLLKPYGVLVMKWNNQQIASSDMLKLLGKDPLVYQISSTRRRSDKCHTQTLHTLWFTFMKILEEAKKVG